MRIPLALFATRRQRYASHITSGYNGFVQYDRSRTELRWRIRKFIKTIIMRVGRTIIGQSGLGVARKNNVANLS